MRLKNNEQIDGFVKEKKTINKIIIIKKEDQGGHEWKIKELRDLWREKKILEVRLIREKYN